ncbi:transcriptional corepressor LEUNIG_HOMOLOG isoform X2 [Ricinus communis]|uniref:transcriptional corepressor LEUNIG_HOMOLOG isoform X2 n=1 Tax=Ricinus communis TaxID=3988 RepID=UPI00201A295A|nr:transcriptional corepressor LEUNIG_HOMOLOG isoform X2 [Ricinus communis]
MASSDEDYKYWDAKNMLDLYLHDYLVKKKLHKTAAIFRKEADVASTSVAIDSFDGFLTEWWSVFYEIFASRQLKHQEAQPNSIVQAGQMTHNDLQNVYPIMPPLAKNQQRPEQYPVGPDNNKMLGRPPTFILPARMYDQQQQLRQPISNLTPTNLQQQTRNLGTQLVVTNRKANSIAGANPTGVNQVPLDGWLSNLLMQTPNGARQFPTPTNQLQQNLLGQPLALTPANFYGRCLILPKTNLSGKGAQMMVQTKQIEERQDGHNRHPRQQLPDNGRKRRRLSDSRARGNILGSAEAEVDKPVDEVESFLSTVDDYISDNECTPLGTLKYRDSACRRTGQKGFTFQEIGCLHSSKSKVFCCQFSSNGKVLASAGHDKKVFFWNMESFDFNDSSEGHSSLITDVRFKPDSTILATSSFDRTLQIWDATKLTGHSTSASQNWGSWINQGASNHRLDHIVSDVIPTKSLFKLLGHAEQVMALDFHPRNGDVLCSCDSNDEIRLWNVNRGACIKVSKGATKQVRFQPQCGQLLATASGNSINVIDVENNSRIQFNLKGHAKQILSLCWDISGKYIASVSEDSARVWSLASGGNCMNELHSNGNKFQSCAFHPGYPELLMIGGYQSLELWNPIDDNKTQSISAHNGLISALAGSLETEMIASASHDRCVKLWK